MSLPGFTADAALGAACGAYRAVHSPVSHAGVVPQLPIGPFGPGRGYCCCVDFNWGWFGGVTVALMATTRGGLPPWAPAGVITAGPPVNIGPFRVQCIHCPEGYTGSTSDCQCSCGDDDTPCAQRDNVTVCDP